MDIRKQRQRVLKKIAVLPAASTLDVREDGSLPSPSSPSLPYEDLVSLLGYLAQIPDEKAAAQGFTVIIDARRAQAKSLRTALRACQHALYHRIRQAIIVQPEKFLEQQKINFDLILEAYEFKTILMSVHKLSKYVDVTELPEQLGGTAVYDANTWVDARERYEDFVSRVVTRLQEFNRNDRHDASPPPSDTTELVQREGERVIEEIGAHNTQNADLKAAATKVRQLVTEVKRASERPEREAMAAKVAEEEAEKRKILDDHAQGVNRILDWLLGPGEKWLLTLHEIGESRDEARQLVREHEQLALKTKEVAEQTTELCELSTRLAAEIPNAALALHKARDQLRGTMNAFEGRVTRQTEMAKRSVDFHQKLNDFSRKTDGLLESLCTDIRAPDMTSVEAEKEELEKKVTAMQKVYESVMETGANFVEDLAGREFNSIGRDVTRDYTSGIAHLRDQLAAARDRRRRCLDLVDVRRLKLQQIIQLFTCEADAEQAVKWLDELHETLLNDYSDVGGEPAELNALREDRMKLEDTARSTYEYGKQLCQVALVLRRSLRMDMELNGRLEKAWGRLCRALSENEAKLNVSDAFNSTVIEVNNRAEELFRRIDEHLYGDGKNNALNSLTVCFKNEKMDEKLKVFNIDRRRLGGDVKELRHIADLLIQQIHGHPKASEKQAVVAEIRRKVEGVEEKQRKLDSLWLSGVNSAGTLRDAPAVSIRDPETSSFFRFMNLNHSNIQFRDLRDALPRDIRSPTTRRNIRDIRDMPKTNGTAGLGSPRSGKESSGSGAEKGETVAARVLRDIRRDHAPTYYRDPPVPEPPAKELGTVLLSETESYL